MNTEFLLKVIVGEKNMGQYSESAIYIPLDNVAYLNIPREKNNRYSLVLKPGVTKAGQEDSYTVTISDDVLKKLVLNL